VRQKKITGSFRQGVIIKRIFAPHAMQKKLFKVAWANGKVDHNVWENQMEVISESR
jgi:hypothetical protein